VVVATPVVADAPIDWLTRFAFLHAIGAKRLPPGPESWKAFACVANAARSISDRDPTLPVKNWPGSSEPIARAIGHDPIHPMGRSRSVSVLPAADPWNCLTLAAIFIGLQTRRPINIR
jgi:hypothetical protein